MGKRKKGKKKKGNQKSSNVQKILRLLFTSILIAVNMMHEEMTWLEKNSCTEGKINTWTTMSHKMEKERGQIMAHD